MSGTITKIILISKMVQVTFNISVTNQVDYYYETNILMTNGFIICNLCELFGILWNSSELRESRIQRTFWLGEWFFVRTRIQDTVVRNIEYRGNQAKIRESRSQKSSEKSRGKQKWRGIQAIAVRAGETKIENVEFKHNPVRAGSENKNDMWNSSATPSEPVAGDRTVKIKDDEPVEFRAPSVRVGSTPSCAFS